MCSLPLGVTDQIDQPHSGSSPADVLQDAIGGFASPSLAILVHV